MDRPPPDPAKLLEAWMEWERGDVTPGRVMATLKTGGLRDLLEAAVAEAHAQAPAAAGQPDSAAVGQPDSAAVDQADSAAAEETWTPVV
jgi:hypothetical protein